MSGKQPKIGSEFAREWMYRGLRELREVTIAFPESIAKEEGPIGPPRERQPEMER